MSVIEAPTEVAVGTDRRSIFLRAARIVQESGWRKGNQGMNPDGPKCILGSIGAALNAPIDEEGIYSYAFISDFLGGDGDEVTMYSWNDDLEPDLFLGPMGSNDVVAVLRKMANGLSFYEAADAKPILQ